MVVAVAENGFEFAGWSDGVKTTERVDKNVKENIEVCAIFNRKHLYTVTYSADDGCEILGEVIQCVQEKGTTSNVEVKCKNGYRFVGWSDGETNSNRKETNVQGNVELIALSEKIAVKFYSDNYWVRTLYLADLNNVDLSKYVGYKSSCEFVGWGYGDGIYIDNLLGSLKFLFNNLGISDIDDIVLYAVYNRLDNKNIPEKYITIAHALGGYDNKTYLNSRKALENSIARGCRFVEADLAITLDNIIVTSHNQINVTYEELIKSQQDNTSLTVEELFEYMLLYDDFMIDLDTLRWKTNEEFVLFRDNLREVLNKIGTDIQKRLIVEVTPYNFDLVKIIRAEFPDINFLYTDCWECDDLATIENLCEIAFENGIRYASISCDYLTQEIVNILHSYHIYVFGYTISDCAWMYELYDMGVDCIFTDFSLM